MESTCLIDGFGPVPVVQPQTFAEIGGLVRRVSRDGQALYPLGGRTMLGLGLPPERPGLGLDLRALCRVVDYPARDMTITVQAGITLSNLRRLLTTENQRLPIEVPQPEVATLGGALATNTSGPRRYGFGTLRDYVIGISTIDDEGNEVKAGGRVVKNVAGYDLCKLHIGALGTLGIITQVTLKVRPSPEARALLTLSCESSELAPLLDLLHRTRTRPVVVDVLNGAAAELLGTEAGVVEPEPTWVIAVAFEDSADTVNWQVRQLIKEVSSSGIRALEARGGAAGDPVWEALAELAYRPSSLLSFKANLLPQAVANFCEFMVSLHSQILLHAQAGSGIVHGHLSGDLTLERAQTMLKEMHVQARKAQGNVILTHCPTEWKRTLPVWGLPRNDAWLMRQVKEKLDPRRLFNPGRFVDGL